MDQADAAAHRGGEDGADGAQARVADEDGGAHGYAAVPPCLAVNEHLVAPADDGQGGIDAAVQGGQGDGKQEKVKGAQPQDVDLQLGQKAGDGQPEIVADQQQAL